MRKVYTLIMVAMALSACGDKNNNTLDPQDMQEDPFVVISGLPSEYQCDWDYYPFIVKSNVVIQAEVTEGKEWLWCGYDSTKGEVTEVRFAIETKSNETTVERKGKIAFYAPDGTLLKDITVVQQGQPSGFISFADEVVELVCLKRYDKNSDGKLSIYEVKQVWDIPENFFGDTYNKAVISFDELDQFPNVTGIDAGAFAGSSLKRIRLPKNLKGIGRSAFAHSEIESLQLPEGLEFISEMAFEDCQNLKNMVIPSSVTSIGRWLFRNCVGLESLVISENITKIPELFCENCTSLKELTIKGEISNLGAFAFTNCSALTSLTINGPLNNIGEVALIGCKSLKSIKTKFSTADERCLIKDGELHCIAPAGLSSFDIPDGVKAILPEVFYQFELESINIPEGVLTIGRYAFAENEKLTTMTIPSTVRSMGEGVFSDCKNLKTLIMKSTTPPATELMLRQTFFEKIIVPKGCAEAYKTTEPWTAYAEKIVEEE